MSFKLMLDLEFYKKREDQLIYLTYIRNQLIYLTYIMKQLLGLIAKWALWLLVGLYRPSSTFIHKTYLFDSLYLEQR